MEGDFVCLSFSQWPCAGGRCYEQRPIISDLPGRAGCASSVLGGTILSLKQADNLGLLGARGSRGGQPSKACVPHKIFYSYPRSSEKLIGCVLDVGGHSVRPGKECDMWDALGPVEGMLRHQGAAGIKGTREYLCL